MPDQTMKPCREDGVKCTTCGEYRQHLVAPIGDIKICPHCIHLMVDIIEAEAPEAVTWQAAKADQAEACDRQIAELQELLVRGQKAINHIGIVKGVEEWSAQVDQALAKRTEGV